MDNLEIYSFPQGNKFFMRITNVQTGKYVTGTDVSYIKLKKRLIKAIMA